VKDQLTNKGKDIKDSASKAIEKGKDYINQASDKG